MTLFHSSIWSLWITLLGVQSTNSYSQHLCSVFQPFKVTPENAKYQIGGPFPLHTDDCVHVRPDAIQELIAVQWALSHWNQNPQSANYKLAMYAADTCSREMESLSQVVTFLNEAGFFLPKDCAAAGNSKLRTPLGLIMPTIQDRNMKQMTELLSAVQLPIIAYSTLTAQALFNAEIPTVFSTVPTVDHYIKATSLILNQLKTNHVTLVYSEDHVTEVTLQKQIGLLLKSGVIVTEQASLDHMTNSKLVAQGSSDVIVTMTTKDELLEFITSPRSGALTSQKLFISVPVNGESWSQDEIKEFLLYKPSPARLIILQQSSLFANEQFRAYFLDILRNNYQTYSLLATYMQQIYNCSLIGEPGQIDCGQIDSFDLLDGFSYNRAIESAVLATYALGSLTKAVATDPEEPCAKSGPACTRASTAYLKDRLTYTFGESDPQAYRGFNLRFGEDRVLKGLKIEGLYVRRDLEFQADTIMNYSTSGDWRIQADLIKWADGRGVVSWCQPWRFECQKQFCTPEKRYVADGMSLQKTGHLYLMGLFDMRSYNRNLGRCNDSIEDPRTISMPAAFVYTLEAIRQKYPEFNILPEVELGGVLVDACHDSVTAIESVLAASTDKCMVVPESMSANATILPLNVAAFASGQKHIEYDTIRLLFGEKGGIRKPMIASAGLEKASPLALSGDTNLMPDYDTQARTILDLLLKQNWDYVSVLLSEHDPECVRAYEAFRRLVESDDRVCISDVVYARSGRKTESIRSNSAPATRVAVAFTTAKDTVLVLKAASSNGRSDERPIYIFVGDAHDWPLGDDKVQMGLVSKWNAVAWGSVSVQPRRSVSEDFRNFLATINPKRLPERWFVRFWEDYFQCAVTADRVAVHHRACTGSELLPTEVFGRMTREAYFMLGLETLIFTLDGMYKQACPEQKGLCEAFFRNEYYGKLAEVISRTPKIDQQFVIYNYRPYKGVTNGAAYVEIGNWSLSDGLRLNDSWLWYDLEGKFNTSLPESSCRPPLCRCKLGSDFFKKPIQTVEEDPESADDRSHRSLGKAVHASIRKSPSSGLDFSGFTVRRNQWTSQAWAYIFVVVNSLLLLASVLVLGLVCVKMCLRVVKGNQSLGICLLCGVILMYATVYFFIFDSCELLCRLRYVSHSLAYSICFGAMIAKAVQLRNSETLGFNGYVSYWNYWLLLFFIVTVQLALNTQWAIIREPILISFLVEGGSSTPSVILHCSWSSDEFLASQIYVVILLSMALFLSLMNRNVKRNYKETRWLMYTSLICAPIWIVWMISYALIPESFKDTVVVMELITCATVILCFMFGPKLYILLSYEAVLVEYPPGFKLDLGNDRGSTLDKNTIEPTPAYANNNDFGASSFDGDDLEDGQGSVISATSGSTKSTSLSHTSSSASTMTTASDGALAPIYQAVVRKKSRSKKIKVDPTLNAATIGSVSPDVAQRRDMVFGETISSVH